MEYKLEIKKPKKKPNSKDIVLSVTDIQFHTTDKRQGAIGKTIEKAVKNNEEGRIYSGIDNGQDNKSLLEMLLEDQSFVDTIRKYNEQGIRVFVEMPKTKPMLAGKDTVEFMNSKKGKRIIRGFAKNNKKD
jgi:hypothetical protein